MWTVVHIAQNKKIADRISEVLQQEGFYIKIQPVGKDTTNSDNCYEILVPESEVEEALGVLFEKTIRT